jgi:hypothetical protein
LSDKTRQIANYFLQENALKVLMRLFCDGCGSQKSCAGGFFRLAKLRAVCEKYSASGLVATQVKSFSDHSQKNPEVLPDSGFLFALIRPTVKNRGDRPASKLEANRPLAQWSWSIRSRLKHGLKSQYACRRLSRHNRVKPRDKAASPAQAGL